MFIDVQTRQLHKTGEELCGDSVGVHRHDGETVVVLADGLGSGVKANILSTLTQKIALTLFKERLPLDDIVETIAATLPTCKVRDLAYSTFTIIRARDDGAVDLVEFDNPPTFRFRGSLLEPLAYETRAIGGFTLRQAAATLEEGDLLVAASDGLIHAGIGGREPLGWRWEPIAQHLEALLSTDLEAEEVADNLIEAAENLYRARVGDDTTVVALKARPLREVVLAVGPPANPADDRAMTERFINTPGHKIICGGTTAKLVARELGRKLTVDLSTDTRELPPMGHIPGVDLVTEGVITIMHAIDLLDAVRLYRPRVNVHDLGYMYGTRDKAALLRDARRAPAQPAPESPAALLARALRLADRITILVGGALNPAHQNPELPVHLGLKFHLVDHLTQKLQARGKQVEVTRYC
jgi:hypothetical protein